VQFYLDVKNGMGLGLAYGEMFAKLGATHMGHQGAAWCGLNQDETLVMMSHENFHRKLGNECFYTALGRPTRSTRMIAEYCLRSADVLLPVAKFKTDGGYTSEGQVIASQFLQATGRVAEGKFLYVDARTGMIACEIARYFEV
jgi:hypothetical protein